MGLILLFLHYTESKPSLVGIRRDKAPLFFLCSLTYQITNGTVWAEGAKRFTEMKKQFRFLMALLALMMPLAFFTGCSSDDDGDSPSAGKTGAADKPCGEAVRTLTQNCC